MNNLISVLLSSQMVKELCHHCIYTQPVTSEHVLAIHKYLQVWCHKQTNI